MSNRKWLCFACRIAIRRPVNADKVLCPACGQPCECIGHKIPVPPKAKIRAWDELRIRFYQARREYLLAVEKHRVRQIHDLEQEISRLAAMPENAGRQVAIKQLKKRLEAIHDRGGIA